MVTLEVRGGIVVRVFASVLPEQEPIKRALVVIMGCSRIPVDVVRFPAHGAVLIVDECDVDGRAADLGVCGKKVFGRVGVALGIVVGSRLIKQERVDEVIVPAFDIMVRSDAVTIFVPCVSVAVTPISAPVAVLRVVLTPLTIFYVASEVQRITQCNAKVAVLGARLQFEVRNVGVRGQVKSGHLATCSVVLLFHCTAYARGNARFTWGAAFRCDRYDGKLLEGIGSRMEPATGSVKCQMQTRLWGQLVLSCPKEIGNGETEMSVSDIGL